MTNKIQTTPKCIITLYVEMQVIVPTSINTVSYKNFINYLFATQHYVVHWDLLTANPWFIFQSTSLCNVFKCVFFQSKNKIILSCSHADIPITRHLSVRNEWTSVTIYCCKLVYECGIHFMNFHYLDIDTWVIDLIKVEV